MQIKPLEHKAILFDYLCSLLSNRQVYKVTKWFKIAIKSQIKSFFDKTTYLWFHNCKRFLYCNFFWISYGSKSDVGQRARLLLAPGSSYNNNNNSTYLQFPLRLPQYVCCSMTRSGAQITWCSQQNVIFPKHFYLHMLHLTCGY